MKSTSLLAVALLTTAAMAHAEEDCGCAGAPAAAATVPAAPLVLAPAPDPKLTLRLKMPAGQKYAMKMAMYQRSTTILGSQKIEMGFKLDLASKLEVLSVSPEGNMTVRYTFTEYKMRLDGAPMGTGAGKKAYSDAAAEVKKMTDRMSAAFRGQSLTGVLSPEGRTLSMTGMDKLMKAIIAAAPAGSPAERQKAKTMMGNFVKNMSDKDNSLLKMSAHFPDHPVAVGDTWTTTQKAPQELFALVTASTFKLDSRQDGLAKVSLAMKMSTPPVKTATPAPKMQMTLTGGGTGVMEIDEATGMANHSDMTMGIINKMGVPSPLKGGRVTTVNSYSKIHMVNNMTPVQ